MSFADFWGESDFEELVEHSERATPEDVDRALKADRIDPWDFAALLSPSASSRLEELAVRSSQLTIQRFGRTVQLFAPFYVSNECVETCTYCSFSRENPIRRKTLTVEEAVAEAKLLTGRGFRHLLVVSGEHPRHVSSGYLGEVLAALSGRVPSLSVEVQPQRTNVYEEWVARGADGLVVYQETYDREAYARVHLAGKKKDFDFRLATPERGGDAGMKRLGIGALFGLSDWRREAIALALHARYLTKRYWRAFVSVGFPRLRPAAHAIEALSPLSDSDLVRLVCTFRLLLPDVGIVLSTREAPALRDGLVRLGITQMSAGSRTEPGGYSAPGESEEQFSRADLRSPEEISKVLTSLGYDPVWKDWEVALHE